MVDISGGIVRNLSRILLISGATVCGNSQFEAVRDTVHATFGEKVGSIVKSALDIRKVVGEEMTTTEFEVFCPRYGQRFVADTMEDVDAPSARDETNVSSETNEVILCTTDLGLRRYGKKAAAGGGEEEWEERVLLKAKVALPALMEDFVSELGVENIEVSVLYQLFHRRL